MCIRDRLVPFVLLGFRKGVLISLTGFLLTLQPSETVAEKPNNRNETSAKTEINLWDRLWYRDDQLAFELLERGDAETAAQLFQDEKWKSIANYRNKEWGPALNGFANDLSADGFYNQANSLAQLGSLNEAIEKYDRALELNPKDDDAQFNRDLLHQYSANAYQCADYYSSPGRFCCSSIPVKPTNNHRS